MVKSKSLPILGGVVACLGVIALVCACDHVLRGQPVRVSIQSRPETQSDTPSPVRYGKLELPVHISIDLAQTKNTGLPVTLITTVSTELPVKSGALTLKIPPIHDDPERTEALWTAGHPGLVSETAEYTLGFLPEGRYQAIAFFEFTLDREGAEKRTLSKSLYLDVRPDTILSSNVSFRQIDRLALQRDLDERIFTRLERELKTTDRKRVLRELTLLEAGDPAIMRQKIRELRASEPDVARRMIALNRTHSEPTNEIGTGNTDQAPAPDSLSEFVRPPSLNHRGQPASEEAVPVPERLKR